MTGDRDPARALEHDTAEFEERLDRLGEHIEDAEKHADARRADADDPLGDVAGDWEGEGRDFPGGDDPEGADHPDG